MNGYTLFSRFFPVLNDSEWCARLASGCAARNASFVANIHLVVLAFSNQRCGWVHPFFDCFRLELTPNGVDVWP